MDAAQIPDVIAAGTRVRGGGVEGVLVAAHQGVENVGTIESADGQTDVALDAIELLEAVDRKKVAAYNKAADAAAANRPVALPYSRQPGEA